MSMYSPNEKLFSKISQPWNGLHVFEGVYAIAFPGAGQATEIIVEMYNNNSIHLTRLFTPGVTYSIACSTLPKAWSVKKEFDSQIATWRDREAQTGLNHRISTLNSPLGSTLRYVVMNADLALESPNGPFPLNTGRIHRRGPGEGPMSASSFRLALKGGSRIEASVHLASPDAKPEQEEQLIAWADSMVDSMFDSMSDTCHRLAHIDPRLAHGIPPSNPA